MISLEHRVNGVLGYQEKDGKYVAILKVAKNLIKEISIFYDDPYYWVKQNSDSKNLIWKCRFQQKPWKIEDDQFYSYITFKLDSFERRFKYFFKFEYKGNDYAYGESGLIKWLELKKNAYHSFAFTWNFSSSGKYIGSPKWWQETNWYQIFPDKFASAKKLLIETNQTQSKMSGGDLLGILDKLNYINNLGFNGIYLNPIFKASSYHKYDTEDYFIIDPCFGTLSDFKILIKKMKELDMKIMLDGVFNHISDKHPYWLDVLKNKQSSKYKDWFLIHDFDNLKPASMYQNQEFFKLKPYSTFGNVPSMPRLNWANFDVQNYILKIINFWTKLGVDAWRMDVADEISFKMWRLVRAKIEKDFPGVVLLGEIWYDSYLFLTGDQFHSVMNYSFRRNLLSFLNGEISLEKFRNKLIAQKYMYSHEINKGLFNLVNSHDVPRIVTLLNNNLRKVRIGYALLFLFPGCSSFYYGDEVDLGYQDKISNRSIFNWEFEIDKRKTYLIIKELLNYRQKNIEHINKFPAIIVENEKLILQIANGDKASFDFKNYQLIIVNNQKEVLKLIF